MTKVTISINNSKVNISINEGSEINISILGNEVTITNNVIISNHDEVISNHDEVITNHDEVITNNVIIDNHDEVITNHDEVITNHDEVITNNVIIDNHDEVISNHDEVISNHDEVISNNDEVISNNDEVKSVTFKKYDDDRINKIFDDVKIIFNDLKSLNKERLDTCDIHDSKHFQSIKSSKHQGYIVRQAIDFFNEDFVIALNENVCDDFKSVINESLKTLSARRQTKGILEVTDLVTNIQERFSQYTNCSNFYNRNSFFVSVQKLEGYWRYAAFDKLNLKEFKGILLNAYRKAYDHLHDANISIIHDILVRIKHNTQAYKN